MGWNGEGSEERRAWMREVRRRREYCYMREERGERKEEDGMEWKRVKRERDWMKGLGEEEEDNGT